MGQGQQQQQQQQASLPLQAFHFRALLRLNNMGVTMMERNCVRTALLTFQDAVSLAVPNDEANHASLSNLLQTNNQRMAKTCLSVCCDPQQLPFTTVLLSEYVDETESLDVMVSRSCQTQSDDMQRLSLIRLDDTVQYSMIQCVLLFNIGVAQLIQQHEPSSLSMSFFEAGYNSLKQARCCIMKLWDEITDDDEDEQQQENTSLIHLILLSALCLEILCRLDNCAGNKSDAIECMESLDSLIVFVEELMCERQQSCLQEHQRIIRLDDSRQFMPSFTALNVNMASASAA